MNITKYRICLGILIIIALIVAGVYYATQNTTEEQTMEGTFVDNLIETEKLI